MSESEIVETKAALAKALADGDKEAAAEAEARLAKVRGDKIETADEAPIAEKAVARKARK